MSADEQAREVEVVARAIAARWDEPWTSESHLEAAEQLADAALAALEPIRAAERQEAAREGVRIAQAVLAGEDTVESARNASASSLSVGYAMELLDDLLDPEDERLADGVTGRSEA